MVRDFKLMVLLSEGQQIPLALALLAVDLDRAVRSLGGTVWRREVRGLFVTWAFSAYQDARYVRDRLRQVLGEDPRWYLQSQPRPVRPPDPRPNRLEWGNLTESQIDLLLDFTDFAGEASA